MSDEMKLRITSQKHVEKPQLPTEKKERLAAAAQEFESMMTSMMLKSMSDAQGNFFGDGEEGGKGNDTYEYMFQSNISQYISKSQGLGLADKIYQAVTGEHLPEEYKHLKTAKTPGTPSILNIKAGEHAPIKPSDTSMNRLNKLEPIIEKASAEFGVSPDIIKSIILTESAANPTAQSKANAKGLMQLIDSTASQMGVKNVWNPTDNITGGTKYFSQMMERYNGNVKLALAAYNAGPGNVDKYQGVPPFQETQAYVTRVLGYFEHFRSGNELARLD